MNIKEVKELLERFDAGALKKYGQNFLINEHVLTTIATSLGIANKYVIEIGPGLGSLTRYLVKYYDKVLAYEIDPKMIEVLKNTIFDKLVIKEGDFLKSNIDKDIIEHFDSNDIYMIANLPYYITTPILLKVLEETKKITKIVIMIQKEVADRFLGKPNTKDYNSLSVLIQTFMNVKKVIDDDSIVITYSDVNKMYGECDFNQEGYNIIKQTTIETYPNTVVAPFIMLGGTDARHYNEISDCVIRFSPIKVTNEDRKGIHGLNEKIKVETLEKCLEFYQRLLPKL